MRITISERFRPFSYVPGVACLVPGSSIQLKVYPTLIKVYDLTSAIPVLKTEVSLELNGPLNDFAVFVDLEKGCVVIRGFSRDGLVSYKIQALNDQQSLLFTIEKAKCGISFFATNSYKITQNSVANAKDSFLLTNSHSILNPSDVYVPPMLDRLSLGNHKAQDWNLVQRRQCVSEIFPIWARLGQMISDTSASESGGTLALLNECRELIKANEKTQIVEAFLNLFKAGFHGILVPRLNDESHLGFKVPELVADADVSPLVLLTEGTSIITSQFIQVNENMISILPVLAPELHCGRLINKNCGQFGVLDIEWTKKIIRRLVFRASSDADLKFVFQKEVKTYRLREGNKDRGKKLVAGSDIRLEKDKTYFMDNFES